MSSAIASLGGTLELVSGQGGSLYERYRVVKGDFEAFLGRGVFNIHGGNGDDYADETPSEESILLGIEALRRSEKKVKIQLFKKKETGGMVVFGPWWNYALKRLLDLSSDPEIDEQSLGDYTAVKITKALFLLVAQDLNDVMKVGKLKQLNTAFGVDLLKNISYARKVIDHCGFSNLLQQELSAVEAHVEGLKGKTKVAPAANVASPAQNNAAAKKSQVDEAEAKKQKDDQARKMRMQKLRANNNLRRGASSAGAGASETVPSYTAPPVKAAAPSSVTGRDSFAQGREASRPRNDASNNNGYAQKPPPDNGRGSRNAPSDHSATNRDSNGRNSSAQPAYGSQSNAAPASYQSRETDDGWGRKRDGNSAKEPFKTKGTWSSARRILSSNVQADSAHNEPTRYGDNNDRKPPPERDSRGSAPERPPPARDNYSSRDGYDRDQGRGRDHDSRGDRHDSRSDNQSSRYNDSKSDRSDHGRDARDGGRNDRDEFSRSNSKGSGDYSRDQRGDDSRHSRSNQESSSRGYGGDSGHAQGSRRDRSEDRHAGPDPKRFRGPNEASAPTGGGGRGRGAHVNKPAWMTKLESAGSGPTGLPQQAPAPSANPPGPSGMASASTFASNAPLAAPTGGGGRGRGAHVNQPAWMTKGVSAGSGPTGAVQHAPAPTVNPPAPSGMANDNTFRANPLLNAPASGGGGGGGRGRGVHVNKPAWMTRADSTGGGPTGVTQQAPPARAVQQAPPAANISHHAPPANPTGVVGGFPSAGRGRGRGRGRGNTLPAWMTNPTNNLGA